VDPGGVSLSRGPGVSGLPRLPAQEMTLQESATKGVAWSLVQSVGSRLLSTLTFIILARLLTPHVFGVVAFASVAVTLLTLFVQQGLGQALVQVPQLERRHMDTAFWISFGFGCLLAVTVGATAWPLASAVHLPEVGPVLAVLSLGFVLTGLASTQQAILQRRMAFRALAARQLLSSTVGAVVGISCALLGAGVWSLVAQILSAGVVGVVVLWTATAWRPGWEVDKATYAQLFRFSRNVFGGQVMWFLNQRTDDVFIGVVLGPTPLGVYSVAYRLLTLMIEVSIATVGSVALPAFARLQDDIERLRSAVLRSVRLSGAVALPAFSFMVAAGPEVVRVFFGSQWEGSGTVTQVLALLGVATTFASLNGTVLIAIGRPDLVLRYAGIGAVANLIAVALTVQWGLIAVAWALVARAWLVTSPLSIHYLSGQLKLSVISYLRQYATPALASTLLVAVATGVRIYLSPVVSGAPLLVVMMGGGFVSYIAALRLLDRRLLQELIAAGRTMAGRQPRSAVHAS